MTTRHHAPLLLRVSAMLALLLGLALTPATSADAATSMLDRINASRKAAGVAPLARAADMDAVAQRWSVTMASDGKLRHNPDYTTQVTNWKAIAENVAYNGDEAKVHAALMNSDGHRRNILNRAYTQVGIGIAAGRGSIWVTEIFRTPIITTTVAPPPAAPATGKATLPAALLRAPGAASTVRATTVAVTGTDKQLWSRRVGASRWTAMGGELRGAPAVLDTGSVVHFVGQGTNGRLYHRTGARAWHPLAPADAACSEPAMLREGSRVTVACRGGNNALYTLSFAVTNQSPYVQTLRKIGGVLGSGPAATMTAGGPLYLVKGAAYVEGGVGGNVYAWTPSRGWLRWHSVCGGRPAAATAGGSFTMACARNGSTVNYERAGAAGGTPVWQFGHVPGAVVGAPALVPTADGNQTRLFVQGTDAKVYHRAIGADGAGRSWANIPAGATGGASAGVRH